MANRIFRYKQEEHWDIWCEHAIVFPEEMPISKAFTEDNMRKVLSAYSDRDEYPTFDIQFHEVNGSEYVTVKITDNDFFEFVEMGYVIVLQ
jgi:hypothetical protein